jgi:hypothetical protein
MSSPSVQSTSTYNNGDTDTGIATFPENNTAGNTLVVTVLALSEAILSVSDTANGSYGPANVNHTASYTGYLEAIFTLFNCKAGANTVTATCAVTDNIIISIIEYPASYAGSVRDTGASDWTTGITNPSVLVTSTSAGDLVVGMTSNSTDTVQAAGNVGTNPANIVQAYGPALPTEDGLSSGGAINLTSLGATYGWSAIAIAYAPPASAATLDTIGFGAEV